MLSDDNERFIEELEKVLPKIKDTVMLDFLDVEFVSFMILATMVYFQEKIQKKKQALVLTNISPEVEELFKTAKLDAIFKIQKKK